MTEVSSCAYIATQKTGGALPSPVHESLGLSPHSPEWQAINAFAVRDRPCVANDLLKPPLREITGLSYRLQNVPRKVSGEPYFKHVMRTVMHVGQEEILRGLPPEDRRVLLASALLHDALELQRKERNRYGRRRLREDLLDTGMDPPEVCRTVWIVTRLTPPVDGKNIGDDCAYLRYKLKDFRKKFTMQGRDARLMRLVKAADTLANLEETVEDIRAGHEDGKMCRSLTIRRLVFEGRVRIIEQTDPANPFLTALRKELELLSGMV